MNRVVLLGPPGVGKGTQGVGLAALWGGLHIATGQLLRRVLQAAPDSAITPIEKGKFVTDEHAIALAQGELSRAEAQAGFVLDGFPRTVPQALALELFLAERGQPLTAVLLFELDDSLLLERLLGRATCSECGRSVGGVGNGWCTACGSALVRRSDDEAATVQTRLMLYQERTLPLRGFYSERGLLRTVDTMGDIDAVFSRVLVAVGGA